MQLIVQFDDNLLLEYYNRQSPLFFEIYFEHEGKYYPEEHWMDFGEVILYWWVSEVIKGFEVTEYVPELLFMEGNYQLITGVDETGLLKTHLCKVNVMHDLINMLHLTIKQVVQKKQELKLSSGDAESALKRLEDLMVDLSV